MIGWWGAYPGVDGATSGYLLQSGGLKLLLDCGSGVLSRLQQHIGLEQLEAVVLTHYHWDHIADIGCLQYAARVLMDLGRRSKPLGVYGHTESERFADMNYLAYCQGYPIDDSAPLELGELRLTFSRNVHPDTCFSIRVEGGGLTFVYITDTGYCDGLVETARGADLLLCESSLYDEYRGRIPGHLTAGEAGTIAARAGARHLVLTHLPHFGDHERLLRQARKKFGGRVELAESGRCWEL